MNFLDAHIIVHVRYGGALANHKATKYDMIFRPYSDYGNDFDKKTIVNALKLFFAHTILFNTRTQEEFEQYQSVLCHLDSFIPDSDMERVRKSSKILYDKGFIAKILNASAKEYAKKEIDEFVASATPPYSWTAEMDRFLTGIIDYKAVWLREYQAQERSSNDFWNYVQTYCDYAYQLAGIPETETDGILFAPFDQLRSDVINNRYPNILKPYADYIMESS